MRRFQRWLKWKIVGWLLKPEFKVQRDARFRQHLGPATVIIAPADPSRYWHDADRALLCGDYAYLFYGAVEEWPEPEVRYYGGRAKASMD